MLNDFTISKGYSGYIIHNNQHITEATFKELDINGELRQKVVGLVFGASQNLRENIEQINHGLEKRYKSKPTLQVELKGTDLFNVFCRYEGERYVGTAISMDDVLENSEIATKFIELLYEDYVQLQSIINALSELEENMILTYSKK